MHHSAISRFRKASLALALAAASLPLQAQEGGLEEIVVTAQHREENLQDVPIAITAIGAEDIRAADISDLNAISLQTPGFSMGLFNPAQPQLFIRGVGSNADGASEDQSVVVFLDGVYLGRTAGQAFDLFDLERIEILRGPQGTLYGKNAAGGALNLVTQKPTEILTAAVEVSAGDMGYLSTRAKVSGPLSDTTLAKLSVSYKERDGYVESVTSDLDDFNSFESSGIRAQVLNHATESLDLLITADYSKDDRVSPGRNTGTRFLQGNIVAAGPFDPDFYENMLSEEPHSRVDNKGVSLQADWELDGGVITSITAYRDTEADVRDLAFAVDYQYLGLGSLDNYFDENGEQFTQEFRFLTDIGDNLSLQAGVFYLNEKVDRNENLDITCGLLCRRPPASPIYLASGTRQSNETDSYGVFAQATWAATERLDITLGARYTDEEKDASNVGTPDFAFSILQAYDVEMNDSWSAFTPKLAIDYALSDALSAYATVSTGFKSGGYQGMAPTAAAASTPFDEEKVTNFELGLKGTVLDDTLRFAAAAFQMQYDDLQVLVLTVQPNGLPGPQLTQNAGEAEIRGFEFETQWMLGSYLQLMATYAYLDTEYTQLDSNLAPFEGNALRNAPDTAYSLSLVWDYPVAAGYVNARADYTNKDDAYQDIQNQEEAIIPSYDVLNLRLAYATQDRTWEIAGWLKNALDEEYLLHNSVLNPGLAQLPLPAAPRTWGVTLTYQLGE